MPLLFKDREQVWWFLTTEEFWWVMCRVGSPLSACVKAVSTEEKTPGISIWSNADQWGPFVSIQKPLGHTCSSSEAVQQLWCLWAFSLQCANYGTERKRTKYHKSSKTITKAENTMGEYTCNSKRWRWGDKRKLLICLPVFCQRNECWTHKIAHCVWV